MVHTRTPVLNPTSTLNLVLVSIMLTVLHKLSAQRAEILNQKSGGLAGPARSGVIYIYMSIYIYIFTFIHIERERESCTHTHISIYIYIRVCICLYIDVPQQLLTSFRGTFDVYSSIAGLGMWDHDIGIY